MLKKYMYSEKQNHKSRKIARGISLTNSAERGLGERIHANYFLLANFLNLPTRT